MKKKKLGVLVMIILLVCAGYVLTQNQLRKSQMAATSMTSQGQSFWKKMVSPFSNQNQYRDSMVLSGKPNCPCPSGSVFLALNDQIKAQEDIRDTNQRIFEAPGTSAEEKKHAGEMIRQANVVIADSTPQRDTARTDFEECRKNHADLYAPPNPQGRPPTAAGRCWFDGLPDPE